MIVLLFVIGIALIIVANIFFYMILGDVNSKLPPEQRIGALFVNWRFFEVLRRHGMLYPHSNARRRMKLLFAAGLLLILVGFAAAPVGSM